MLDINDSEADELLAKLEKKETLDTPDILKFHALHLSRNSGRYQLFATLFAKKVLKIDMDKTTVKEILKAVTRIDKNSFLEPAVAWEMLYIHSRCHLLSRKSTACFKEMKRMTKLMGKNNRPYGVTEY